MSLTREVEQIGSENGGDQRTLSPGSNENAADMETPPMDSGVSTANYLRRKRRGSVSPVRHDTMGTAPIDIAAVPPRRLSGLSKRTTYQTPRPRKLSPAHIAAILANAGNRTLRELAAGFGVSHETIRTVVRQHHSVPGT